MKSDIVFRDPRERTDNGVAICGVVAVFLFVTAVCAAPRGDRPRLDPQMGADREINVRLMLSCDENSDGVATRQEQESNLKRQFEALDPSKDGVLDSSEMEVENTRRFRASGSSASPLLDWNKDGRISFDEFATTARSTLKSLNGDTRVVRVEGCL